MPPMLFLTIAVVVLFVLAAYVGAMRLTKRGSMSGQWLAEFRASRL